MNVSMQLSLKIYTLILFAVGMLFLNFTVDDAFITFRYGKNLVEYGVWNWNPNAKDVVEAYTNPLYAGLSIIPHLLDFNVLYLFKIIGIVLIFQTYVVLSKGLDSFFKWVCGAFIVTNITIFPHAFSGLETVAFFLTAFYVMTLDDGELRKAIPSFIIFLAPLIRPEGALLSIFIIYRQSICGGLTIYAKVAIGFGVFYFVTRYVYFGHLFPNTFYAKHGNGIATFIGNIRRDIEVICGWLIAFVVIRKYNGRMTLPVLLFAGYLLANMTAELQMNYSYRFAWHMIYPAIFYAFWLVVRGNNVQMNNVILPILFIIAAMISFSPVINVFSGITYYQKIIKSHRALGKTLSKYNKDKLVLAVGDVGLIPYYSGMDTIDYVGLANVEVAHAIKEKREPILPKPDIFIIYSRSENSCVPSDYSNAEIGVTALLKNISIKNYSCIPGPDAAGSFYLNILIRRDFYDYSNIVADIAEVKKKSSFPTRLRDALFFPGLR